MNRRSFLAAIAALPLVGLVPKQRKSRIIYNAAPDRAWTLHTHTASGHTHSITTSGGEHTHSITVGRDDPPNVLMREWPARLIDFGGKVA